MMDTLYGLVSLTESIGKTPHANTSFALPLFSHCNAKLVAPRKNRITPRSQTGSSADLVGRATRVRLKCFQFARTQASDTQSLFVSNSTGWNPVSRLDQQTVVLGGCWTIGTNPRGLLTRSVDCLNSVTRCSFYGFERTAVTTTSSQTKEPVAPNRPSRRMASLAFTGTRKSPCAECQSVVPRQGPSQDIPKSRR